MESQISVILIFVVAFLIFLIIGWPIAFAIGSASMLAYVFIAGEGALGNFAVLAYNAMFNYDLLALPIFILMGAILIQGGVASRLYDAVVPLMDRFPGGLIHTNVVANVILGSCCGSTIAATSAMSAVAVPELLKRGYKKPICYGSLAATGCLAGLIPPSVGMILYSSITPTDLGTLFIAGIIPGLILAVSFSIVIVVWVKYWPEVAPMAKEIMPFGKAIFNAIKHLWPLLILIFVVLGAIYSGIATATESGCYGIAGALLLSYKNLTRKSLGKALSSSSQISGALLLIIAMASVYGFALNGLGLRQMIIEILNELPGGTITKIWSIWMLLLVLGMFIDSASVTVIATPILLPFVTALGFDSVWFGIFLILATELGNISPPVGVTLFAVQSTTGDSFTTIAKGALPFWISNFMAVTPIIWFPAIVSWLPSTGLAG